MSDSANLSFEQKLAALEKLVQQLEGGELELAEAMTAFEQGVSLSKDCQQMLAQAELKIQHLKDQTEASS